MNVVGNIADELDDTAAACQVTTYKALQAALLHPAVSSDPRQLCSMAATCRSWRTAIQTCQSRAAEIEACFWTLQRLASLALWLPRYAGVVASISLCPLPHIGDGADAARQAAVEALLLLSIQQATLPGRNLAGLVRAGDSGAAAPSGAAAAAAAAVAPCLRLKSFSSGPFSQDAAMLSALPAASLTCLSLTLETEPSRDTNSTAHSIDYCLSGITAVLPVLTNLQEVVLRSQGQTHMRPGVPAACLAALSGLQQLSSLTINSCQVAAAAALPLQLQRLKITPGVLPLSEVVQLLQTEPVQGSEAASLAELLHELHLDTSDPFSPPCIAGRLDLAHLTNLQQLHLNLDAHLLKGSRLPSQLQSLTIMSFDFDMVPLETLNITSLQQLQQLDMTVSYEKSQLLAQVGQLSSLQRLQLHYGTLQGALAAAPAWKLLPQLQELAVQHDAQVESGIWDPEMVRRLFEGAGEARSLTRLELMVSGYEALYGDEWDGFEEVEDGEEEQGDEQQPPAAGAGAGAFGIAPAREVECVIGCSYLTGLTNLQHLALRVELQRGDALHLSMLTALTNLSLYKCGDGVDDTAAVAIACGCRKLQCLSLYGCGLSSSAAFPAIGALLTDLQQLELGDSAACTQSNFMMLTGLTKLTSLGHFTRQQLSEAGCERFWAAVRARRQQQQQQEATVAAAAAEADVDDVHGAAGAN